MISCALKLKVSPSVHSAHMVCSRQCPKLILAVYFLLYCRYSTLWQWTDGTIALYYDFDWHLQFSPTYCAAYHEDIDDNPLLSINALRVIKCDSQLKIDFLCEIPSKSDLHLQSVQLSDILLPKPVKPASDIQGIVECNDRCAAWQFLGCDSSSGVRDSEGTPPCPHDRRDLDSLWFQCRDNSGCVPYTLVCDHRQDCADGSDEDFCVVQPCTYTQSACRDGRQVCALNRTLETTLTAFHRSIPILSALSPSLCLPFISSIVRPTQCPKCLFQPR